MCRQCEMDGDHGQPCPEIEAASGGWDAFFDAAVERDAGRIADYAAWLREIEDEYEATQ